MPDHTCEHEELTGAWAEGLRECVQVRVRVCLSYECACVHVYVLVRVSACVCTDSGRRGALPPRFRPLCCPPFLSQPHRSKRLRIDRPVCEPWKGPVGAGSAARAGSLACGRGWAEGSAARRPHGLGQHCPFAQRARSPQGG